MKTSYAITLSKSENAQNLCSGCNDRASFNLYAGVFALSFSAMYIADAEGFHSWFVVVLNVIWLLLGKQQVLALLSSFLISNELAAYCSVAAWLLLAPKDCGGNSHLKIDRMSLVLICLILANSVLQSYQLGTLANTIAYFGYIAILAWVGRRAYLTIDKQDLMLAVKSFAAAEAFVSLLIIVRCGVEPSDAHYGTFGNAHYCGLICGVMLLLITCELVSTKRGLMTSDTLLCILLTIVIFLADAKAAIGAGVICIGVCLLFWFFNRRSTTSSFPVIGTMVTVLVAMIAASFLLDLPTFRNLVTSQDFPLSQFFNEYVYFDGLGTNKFEYMAGTLSQMTESGQLLCGYGLGDYGSRFANLFGYTYTYRPPGALNDLVATLFDSHMLPEYANYASKYSVEVASVIQWYSAVLSYPFSSVISVVAEIGLIGIVLIMRLIHRARLNLSAQLVLAFFFGACITDLYLDHLQSAGVLAIVIAVNCCMSNVKNDG
ncbi:hypothetical protein [Enorma massiliensis]|uniref:hypothetical protein n=1 Tax=Enorma massiliensis TaxID=1472761 RepID=UPI0023EFF1F2|nr:hypothetical protein [Enorma massiliensis]